MTRSLRLLLPVGVAVAAAFAPVLGFAFLNWDDQAVIVDNPSLAQPGILAWAFSTIYMEHYQPLSWAAWWATRQAFGVHAAAFHAVNLVAHTAAALLVLVNARLILGRALAGRPGAPVAGASAAAALLFALHPLRAEVVAWVSAFPYTLALVFALASLSLWLRDSAHARPRSILPALAWFAASLFARPVALGLPAVLVILDVWLHGRSVWESAKRAWPFALFAAGAAVAEAFARGPAAAEVPWLFRLQLAATAPFVYLWRTVAPLHLTPLDALPLAPEANLALLLAALAGLGTATFALWRWRREWPGLAAAWGSYLALLAPAAGLLPSGLQATADRYTYLPGVVVAIAVAGLGAHLAGRRPARQRLAAAAAALLVAACVVGMRNALVPWADSVALWTRVVTIDPRNDIGLYNLGTVLAAQGRQEEATARYREAVAANPAHAEARANLDRLDAGRLEREGNDLAAAGDLLQAVQRYEEALARDPGRTHSRAALGMALATLGRHAEARSHLEEARRQGNTEAPVANALGVLLAQAGETRAARAVLESGLSAHRNDVGLALNLTQVLLSSAPGEGGDARLALRLATAVSEATGARDPRIVETLAAALAANGRLDEARATNARAASLAREQGDAELAVQITARGRAYRNPGP